MKFSDYLRKIIKDETIIQINEQDEVIKGISKYDAHLENNIKNNIIHRAFSLFLINQNDEIYIQQRSGDKILFPLHWTNSVCSHPLYNETELIESNNYGLKYAARRRLEYELGIKHDEIEDYHYHFKMKYIAYNPEINKKFGESEIDHIITLKINFDNYNLNNFRKDEVNKYELVKIEDIQYFIKKKESENELISPWFKIISNNLDFLKNKI